MPQHKRGPWSATEDQYLLHLVNLHGAHNWVRISSTIGTRSPKQCRERFHQNLKPNLNHDPITPEEGVLIEQMVAEMGKRWAEIARRLRGRSDNAVKNWWNGGMNRRRRSNNHRRQEVTVRQPVQQQTVPILNHPQMPAGFQQPQMQQQMPQQFFQQPMYQQQPQMQFPQHMSLPSNVHAMRHHGLVETPLPSPSTYSQMSGDGAPSMVSDRSSISGRSPHNNGSPIELPPLSGNRGDRRQSAAPQLSLGTPNVFASDTDFSVPTMHITRYEDQLKQPQMLQEPFLPAQPQMYHAQQQRQFMQQPMQPMQHMQQQMQPVSRQPSPMHQYQMQQQQQHHQQQQQYHQAPMYTPQRNNSAYSMQQSPTDQSVQLPRIPDMAAPALDSHQQHRKSSMQLAIDPALMAARGTPVPSVHTPEGSPRDKMSLSNITL